MIGIGAVAAGVWSAASSALQGPNAAVVPANTGAGGTGSSAFAKAVGKKAAGGTSEAGDAPASGGATSGGALGTDLQAWLTRLQAGETAQRSGVNGTNAATASIGQKGAEDGGASGTGARHGGQRRLHDSMPDASRLNQAIRSYTAAAAS